MYIPKPGSNIEKILKVVNVEGMSSLQIRNKLITKYPDFPVNSISTHLAYLIKQKVISRSKDDFGVSFYQIMNGTQVDLLETAKPSSNIHDCVLSYLKARIGKKVTTKEVQSHCLPGDPKSSRVSMYLINCHRLGVAGIVDGSHPREYLILPEINTINRIPIKVKKQELIKQNTSTVENDKQFDLANMSLLEIAQDYLRIKQENERLRHVLQRILNEVMQIGEIE